ncbi:MAG TPA: hypothetical protein VIN07_09845 [Flavipsychrobacter sp.]
MTLKFIALSAYMFTTTTLFAQGKFFASVSAGAGQSAANVKLDYNNYRMANYDNISSYYLHAGLGYEIRRWRLSAGVEFFRTGFYKGFAYSNDQLGFYEKIMAHNENTAIPLLLSYEMRLLKNVSIVPAAGAAMIFAGKTHYNTNDFTLNIDPWDNLVVNRNLSMGAIAKVTAEVSIGKKIILFAGPSLRYYKPNPSLHYYLYLGEIGITRHF